MNGNPMKDLKNVGGFDNDFFCVCNANFVVFSSILKFHKPL